MIDRARLSEPQQAPVGFQTWSDLTFMHWQVSPDQIQNQLPRGVMVDTWQDQAWLGVVAFEMSRVRMAGFPAVPYFSRFPEINLRTYVHVNGRPGVWFFSLEAPRLAAVLAARWGWHLNYRWSRVSVQHKQSQIRYSSRRWRGPAAAIDIEVKRSTERSPEQAREQTLDYFLCERYVLFTTSSAGKLLTAQVHHVPYPLVAAESLHCQQRVSDTIGLSLTQPDHVIFSPGVNVKLFRIEPAGR